MDDIENNSEPPSDRGPSNDGGLPRQRPKHRRFSPKFQNGEPFLSAEEEDELLKTACGKKGDIFARNKLVNGHHRFVRMKAKEFASRMNLLDHLDDLIAEGTLGFIRAIEKFDRNRGTRLISYAAWWIRAYMIDYFLRTRHHIHSITTLGARSASMRYSKAESNLWERLDRSPTVEEIAEYLEIKPEDVERVRIARLPMVYLDEPLYGKDGDSLETRGDRMESLGKNPEDNTAESEEVRAYQILFGKLFSKLSYREQKIIKFRHLVDEDDALSLTELGEAMGISRERVRQLEVTAFRKMRATGHAGYRDLHPETQGAFE